MDYIFHFNTLTQEHVSLSSSSAKLSVSKRGGANDALFRLVVTNFLIRFR